MAYRESGQDRASERNPSGAYSTSHDQPSRPDDARSAPMQDHRRESNAWRHDRAPEDDGRYDDYPRNPETAEWLRRTQGRETEREREVYMLERERDLREREKQRDAWYRHANSSTAPTSYDNDRHLSGPNASPSAYGKGQSGSDRPSVSTVSRSGRDEWERERNRAYREEEYGRSIETSRRRPEDADYQRSVADVSILSPCRCSYAYCNLRSDSHLVFSQSRSLLPVGGYPAVATSVAPPRGTVSPTAYTTSIRRGSHDYPRSAEEPSGYPYYPSPAPTQRELGHRDAPTASAPGYPSRASQHRISGPQNLPAGAEDRPLDPHHYSTTDYHRLAGHAYSPPSPQAATASRRDSRHAALENAVWDTVALDRQREMDTMDRQRRLAQKPIVDPRASVESIAALPLASAIPGHSSRNTGNQAVVVPAAHSPVPHAGHNYPSRYVHPDAPYVAPYDPSRFYSMPSNQPLVTPAFRQAVAEREEREAAKYTQWQNQKRARLEELMEQERRRRARAAARQSHSVAGGIDFLPISSRNGAEHLAPDSSAPSRSHTPVEVGAVGTLRRQLKAQHKAGARARKERKEEIAAAAAVAARVRTSHVDSRYTSPNRVDELDDELMDLVGEEGSGYAPTVPSAAGPAPNVSAFEAPVKPPPSRPPRPPRKKNTKKIEDPAELPDEDWPTKGIRNKDGTWRKKPGPPKGVKKGAALGKSAFGAGAAPPPAPASDQIHYGASIGDELHSVPAASMTSSKRRKINGNGEAERKAIPIADRQSSPYEELAALRPADVDNELADMLGDRSPTNGTSQPPASGSFAAEDPLARSLSTIEQSRRLLQDLNSRPESQQPEILMRTKKTGKKTRDRAGSGSNVHQAESDRAGSTDPRGDFQDGMPGKSELPPHSSLGHDRALPDDVQERPWEQPLQVQNALTSPQSRYNVEPTQESQVVSQAGSLNVSRQASPLQPTFEDTYGVDEIDEMSPPPGEHVNNAVARRRHLTVEAMQALIWQDLACNQIPNVGRTGDFPSILLIVYQHRSLAMSVK